MDEGQQLAAAVRVRRDPTVLHMDADAFFAAVEQLTKPSLRGKPVLVGGTGPRGVVATASYEARAYGARSAMAMSHARRLCPQAAVLAPRFGVYQRYSAQIMAVLAEHAAVVQAVSIDEAYADLDGTPGARDVAATAAVIQAQVRQATGLSVSIGAGRSKLVAKIASDARKPAGITVIDGAGEDEFLLPRPVRAIPGIGPATAASLEQLSIRTIADLRSQPWDTLTMLLGRSSGTWAYLAARGLDDRPVHVPAERKSAGAERTFPVDLHGREQVAAAVDEQLQEAMARLERSGAAARTVTVKLRDADFATITRSVTLTAPTFERAALAHAAQQALAAAGTVGRVRLVGVSLHALADHAQPQLELDPDDHTPATAAAASAVSPATGPAGPVLLSEQTFHPGVDVTHPKHGAGWVVHLRGRQATVRFEDATTGPATSVVLDLDSDPLTLLAR